MAFVKMLPNVRFKPIDLNASGWVIYSQNIGQSGGVTIDGPVLNVWGYSDPAYDSYSSGGAQTIRFRKAKSKTLSYSFTTTGKSGDYNRGRTYIYLYDVTTQVQTTLWSPTNDSTVTKADTFIIPNNDEYMVRMYVQDAGGLYGITRKTITVTCNYCNIA